MDWKLFINEVPPVGVLCLVKRGKQLLYAKRLKDDGSFSFSTKLNPKGELLSPLHGTVDGHKRQFPEMTWFEFDDYLNSYQIAKMINRKSETFVSHLRSLFDDFPQPIEVRSAGRSYYYKTNEIIDFFKRHNVSYKEL